MFECNGNRQRLAALILVLIDSFFVLAAVLGAILVRFSGDAGYFFWNGYLALRIFPVVFIVQLGFYYVGLYDPRLYEWKKMLTLFLASFGVSSALIVVIYYLIPSLILGRGVFAVSFILIFIFSYSWRLFYARVFKLRAFAERVLIIGTGALAKKIEEEINAYDGFKVVGFVDENRAKIGKEN